MKVWKSCVVCVLCVCVSKLHASHEPAQEPHESFLFHFALQANYLLIHQEAFIQVLAAPEFFFPRVPLGFALYLPVEFNAGWDFRTTPYTSAEALVGKLSYFQYGVLHEGPFALRVSPIENYTLGYGLLVRHYSNELSNPEIRKLGLQTHAEYSGVVVEGLFGDLLSQNLLAGRLAVYPSQWWNVPVVKDFSFGVTVAGDMHPGTMNVVLRRTPTTYKIVRAEHEIPSVLAFSVDSTFCVLDGTWGRVSLYAEYARMNPRQALGYGFVGQAFPESVALDYRFEFRHLWSGFVPGYFNALYDVLRATEYQSGRPSSSLSWYVALSRSFFEDRMVMLLAYEEMFQGLYRPHIRAELTVKKLFDRLTVNFYYDQFDVQRQATFSDGSTHFLAQVVYAFNQLIEFGLSLKKGFVVYHPNTSPEPMFHFSVFSSLRF